MTKGKREYTREFKLEAIELAYGGEKKVAEVARELGITPKILYRWKSELEAAGEFAFPGSGNRQATGVADKDVTELHKEIARLQEERAILKKALAIFSRGQR